MDPRFVPGVAPPPGTAAGRQYVIVDQAVQVVQIGETFAIPRGPVDAGWLYLGTLDGEPCFARTGALDGAALVPLRQLYGALEEDDFAVASRALGLTSWDRDHRHCGRCGAATERSTKERARTCSSCRFAAYPRLSPAVIVLVVRDGRALLARNRTSSGRFHSCLAGFVEVGESLEDTVHRELAEEVGIRVTDVDYFASQAWPLTNSLMIGFTARWLAGELEPDGEEIVEAAWYGADELPVLPSSISISRALIDDFVRTQRTMA